eukprot:COSAG01_NODE_1962_length_8790_cov_10.999540_6_plen_115_part_00
MASLPHTELCGGCLAAHHSVAQRTAKDYASLCEGVWPLFARRGCRRPTTAQLEACGVLKRRPAQAPVGSALPPSIARADGFSVRPPWRPVTSTSMPAEGVGGGFVSGDVLHEHV